MSWKELIVFCTGVMFPVLYYRLCLALFSESAFQNMYLRRLTGLNLHHMHLGFGLVVLSQILLLLHVKRQWCLLIGCLGIGFILDEFAASLYIPAIPRSEEMRIYKQSAYPTYFIIAMVVALAVFCVLK